MKSAILMSGGIESTALLYWLRPELAINIDYGQLPASGEARAARKICAELGIRLATVSVNCRDLGSGVMSGAPASEFAHKDEWWPFRNQLLITLGCMKCIQQGIGRLLIGTVCTDSHYADGTEEFVSRIDDLVVMQEGGVRVEAPAIRMKTEELIAVSRVPASLLALSHSCLRSEFGCGECVGCLKHENVLANMAVGDCLIE